jgi:sugar phosphate isomerase/epimerase
MKLGLSSYTFGWAVGVGGHEPPHALDEHGLLDKCRQLGVALLQIGDNLPLHTFDTARISSLAERAAKEGVELEIGARGLTRERVIQYAHIARGISAKLIRFVIGDAGHQPTREAVVGVLREVIPQLDGLTLGIENHDRFSAATLRSVIEATGSDRIGVCLDTVNSLGSGEGIETVATILAPYTVNLHVKDFAIERVPNLMGFSVSGRPAGEGILDIPSLLRQLAEFGRCETAVLELWTPPEARLEETIVKEARWAKQSLDYLRPLFSPAIAIAKAGSPAEHKFAPVLDSSKGTS